MTVTLTTVTEWLLDSDPSIRWQVMRDLTDEPVDAVTAERAKVATEGWGERLLALQAPDGQWDGGTYFPSWATGNEPQPWTATAYTLSLLRDLGAGAVHFEVDDGDGEPSRWNTLRALRVLRWWEGSLPRG